MLNRKISALLIISLLFSLTLTTSEAATKSKRTKSKATSDDVKAQTKDAKKTETTEDNSNVDKLNRILAEWTHEDNFNDKSIEQTLNVKITYYSNEYVETLVNAEAEKNLWTNSEMENYKYTLLKNLNLAESIPFHIRLYVRGTPIYPAPFDKHIKMRVGKNTYSPIDFDKRLNFKILGERDGLIFFPRYDPKTGKEILEGAKDIRVTLDSAISHAMAAKGDTTWVWDLTKDRGKITEGTAANRLEVDRLIKRSDKLKEEREELQKKLEAINKEFDEINSRIDELQEQ